MGDSKHAHPGSEPTNRKKHKTTMNGADRAMDYAEENRGGQGIMPIHTHTVAVEVSNVQHAHGTSNVSVAISAQIRVLHFSFVNGSFI